MDEQGEDAVRPSAGPARSPDTDAVDLAYELADEDGDVEDGPVRHGHGGRHRLDNLGEDAQGRPIRRGGVGLFLRDLVIVAVLAIAISMLVRTFLIRPYYIPSASMHDTLVEQDRVLVNLLAPEVVPLSRGDIIVFEDPGGWLPQTVVPQSQGFPEIIDGALKLVGLRPEDTTGHLIKRIIGLPGDHVVCCNAYGQIMVNDVPISEPYVELAGNSSASGTPFDVTVPTEAVWVMGDNRYNSEDSRYHQDLPTRGFVPYSDIVGTAVVINWPFSRIGFLGNYPEVFAQVPNRSPQP